MDLTETGPRVMNWTNVVQDRNHCWAVVEYGNEFLGYIIFGKFFSI